MEHKMNASSSSYGGNSSYRSNKSTYEENSDEEINDEDLLDEETSDLCSSEAVSHEVLRSGSPEERSLSPKTSPILLRKRVLSPGDSAKEGLSTSSLPAVLETRVKRTTTHEIRSLSKSDLSPSQYPSARKPLHSTPVENTRSRSEITPSQGKVQTKATERLSDISRESLGAVKRIPSPRATKSDHSIRATAPVVSKESLKPQAQENHITVIVLCVALIVAGFYALTHVANDSRQIENYDDSQVKPSQILEDFLKAFDQLNSSFPKQTSTFWKVLRSGTRSIIVQDYPIAPAVFIVAVPKDAQKTALCIVRKYAAVVTRAFQGRQPIEFTHHLRSADTPERIKHVIDDTLNQGFSEGSRVAIIHELNKLHGKAAMMFHGYCDNENAPFTRVVVLFTLFMDGADEETDVSVERKLSQVWGKYLDNDKLFPLLSRIGNRNAFARQESDEVLEAHGCL